MDLGSTLQQAATLMLTGMGVVFIFLTMLIMLVKLISHFVPQDEPSHVSSVSSPSQNNGKIPSETIVAISAAVNKYRSRQR